MATGREFEVYPDRRKIAERRERDRAEADRRRDPFRFDVGMLDRSARGDVFDTILLDRALATSATERRIATAIGLGREFDAAFGHPFPLDPRLVGRDALVRRAYDAEVRR